MVLASLICTLPAVTIAPEMAFLILSSGYSIIIYFNCIWGGSGKVAAFTVGQFHREGCGPGNRIVTPTFRQPIHLPLRIQVRFNTKKATPKPSPWNLASWARVKNDHLAKKLKKKPKQNKKDRTYALKIPVLGALFHFKKISAKWEKTFCKTIMCCLICSALPLSRQSNGQTQFLTLFIKIC